MLIKTPDSPLDSIRSILEGAKYACITSPYIKEAFIQRIKSSLSRISTVKTLVRLTNYEISTRTVDLSALDILKELGEVCCLSTLHAKTLLTD